jgi:hypothetical protein
VAILLSQLDVFAPGADLKTEMALKANALVPSDATYKNPLIVVAPKHHQQPPQGGELRCCSRIQSIVRSQVLSSCFQFLPTFHQLLQSQCYSNRQFSTIPYRKWCGKQRPWNMGSLPCDSKSVCHHLLPFQNQRTTSL